MGPAPRLSASAAPQALAGRYALDAEVEEELRALNAEDLAFYAEACRRFDERVAKLGAS